MLFYDVVASVCILSASNGVWLVFQFHRCHISIHGFVSNTVHQLHNVFVGLLGAAGLDDVRVFGS